MPTPTRIALLGFNRFEREAFESYFRLAGEPRPAYVLEAEPTRSHCIVADADDALLCTRLAKAGWMSCTLAIGASTRSGAAMRLPRPIDMTRVVRALDALPRRPLGARPSPPPKRVPAARPVEPAAKPAANLGSQVERVLVELAYRTGAIQGPADLRSWARAGAPREPAATTKRG